MSHSPSILTADIGGTNSRFAYFLQDFSGNLKCLEITLLKTTEFSSFAALLEQLQLQHFGLPFPRYDLAVFGVAGFVQNNFCTPPNISWNIDGNQIKDDFGFLNCLLINDFTAQAAACLTNLVEEALVIQKGHAVPHGVIGVIGAGTGLGHCALAAQAPGHWAIVPSEAGHSPFSFFGTHEQAYEQFVLAKTRSPYCYGDLIVSGQGLSRLHEFLTGRQESPAEIAAQFHPDLETLQWFARFYGRACRSYALAVLPTSGLYIAGGIAAKNPLLVQHPIFLEEFQNSPTQRHLLNSIPILLNTNELGGLFGAARYGIMKTTA